MSKYSVGGTEIIDDSGKIDWNKIKNAPNIYGPQGITTTYTNCSTQGNITSTANSSTGSVLLTVTTSGGAGYACNCQCQCACACDCACTC